MTKKKKRIILIILIVALVLLILLKFSYMPRHEGCLKWGRENCGMMSYITEDYDRRHYECNAAVIDGDCGRSSCNSDILSGVDCGIMGYFKIHVLKIKPRNYKSWKDSCEYVNNYLNCGGYDCSIEGYYFNHNLCWH